MVSHNYGSVKNQIIASDLTKERAKIAFDKKEMVTFLLGGQDLVDHRNVYKQLQVDYPELRNTHRFNEMTIHERQMELWKRVHTLHKIRPDIWMHMNLSSYPYHGWFHNFQGLVPIGMHMSMFAFVVYHQANDEQRAYWYDLIQRHKILGNYC